MEAKNKPKLRFSGKSKRTPFLDLPTGLADGLGHQVAPPRVLSVRLHPMKIPPPSALLGSLVRRRKFTIRDLLLQVWNLVKRVDKRLSLEKTSANGFLFSLWVLFAAKFQAVGLGSRLNEPALG